MTVKVVADSVCDLPAEIVRDLDITIIPISVVFGDKVYRDGIDITTDEFLREAGQLTGVSHHGRASSGRVLQCL